ncbi:MAG TPA: PEP-CTERM sorting domain-containing protein [Bryobacteraceae bacterium]|nr:PEP-CTERM sorting domain-containing protein [Bryobacteraceae bacterium]
MKIAVLLAMTGVAALVPTARTAVMTPANDPFAGIGATWSVNDSTAMSGETDAHSQAIAKAEDFTPEPATLGLIGAGLTTIGLLRRRSRKR